MRKILLALLLLASPAFGQSVRQSGNITPGHSACWAITGVIYDCGTPGGSSIVGPYTANDLVAVNGSGSLIDSGVNPTTTTNWPGLINLNGGATAPTRPLGDNTTNVATTAFVKTNFANFTPATPNWVGSVVQNGVFIDVNNYPLTSFFGGNTLGVYSGLTAAVKVDPSSTLIQVNGLSGYVQCNGTITNCVGSYGSGTMAAANGMTWGANTNSTNSPTVVPTSNTGLDFVSVISNEGDVNIEFKPGNVRPAGSAIGFLAVQGGEAQPLGNFLAFSVQIANGAAQWEYGLAIQQASTSAGAILIGAGGATNADSQFLTFQSRNPGGTLLSGSLFLDPNGNLISNASFVDTAVTGSIQHSPATGNALFNLAPQTIAQLATVAFYDGPTLKWEWQKDAGNDLALVDVANSANAFLASSAGNVTIGEAGKTVTVAGSLSAPTIFSPTFTGTMTMPDGATWTSSKLTLASLTQFGFGAGTPSHVATGQTTPPALTACGTGSPTITGTDTAGIVTMGTSASGCTITFNVSYTSIPYCVVTWIATPLMSQSYVTAAATITLTQTATSGNKVQYVCVAQSGG